MRFQTQMGPWSSSDRTRQHGPNGYECSTHLLSQFGEAAIGRTATLISIEKEAIEPPFPTLLLLPPILV